MKFTKNKMLQVDMLRRAVLSFLLLFGAMSLALANLTVAATSTSTYVAGGTSTIEFEVTLVSTNLEYADYVEIVTPAGWTVASSPAQSYTGCGDGLGDLVIGATSVYWERSGTYPGGTSGCGAFNGNNSPFTFEVTYNVPASADPVMTTFTVNAVGDGWNEPTGTITSTTFDVLPALCEFSDAAGDPLPSALSASAAAGACDAFVAVPDAMVAAGFTCFGAPTSTIDVEGPETVLNFDPDINVNTLIATPFSIPGVPVNVAPGVPTVDLTVTVVGDFGAGVEQTDILAEDGVTVLGQTGISPGDCVVPGGVVTLQISAADYNAMAADGQLDLSLAANGNVNNICVEALVSGAVSVADATSGDVIMHDFAGGASDTDASGTYPVGVTVVTYTSTDANGATVTHTLTVTVTDDEDPTIACPSDIFINLGPGECDATISYAVSAADNCPILGPAVSLSNNSDFTDENVAGGISCDGVSADFNTLQVIELAGDISIQNVAIYIAENGGAVDLTANVYSIASVPTGNFNYSALTLLSTGALNYSGSGDEIISIPVAEEIISAGTAVVIEVQVPAGNPGTTIGFNDEAFGGNGHTYVAGCIPAFANPTTYQSLGFGVFTTNNAIMQLNGFSVADDPVVQVAGLASGSTFPVGTTTNTFSVTDAAGNTVSCSFDVVVNPFTVTNNTMTCNSLVHVTVDENCQAVVGADQILEGDQYGCYDDYQVLFDDSGLPLVLGAGHIGQTIDVRVVSPAGIACWGKVLVEDKNIPDLTCEDFTLKCDDPTAPGSLLEESASDAAFPTAAVTTGAAATYTETIDNAAIGQLVDLNVTINTDHTWVGDLVISVTSPSGTTVELLNNLGGPGLGCNNAAGQNMSVVMDDEAASSYAAMDAQCPPVGTFQPLNALSAFDGESITGTWTLTVEDLVGGDGGDVDVTLNITSSGVVPFPVPSTATVIPAGPNTFTVLGFDPCGPATLTYSDVESGDICNNAKITRSWTITDGSGNSSACSQMINITPTTLADIADELPGDISLECGEPLPAPLSELGCDNIDVTLDGAPVVIDICGGSFKMLRKYIVVDWCTNETLEHTQIIKVLDTEGANLTCPADLTIGTTSNACSGNVALPEPTYTDCGGGVTLVPSIGAGTLSYNSITGVWTVTGLPTGTHTATWTATDDCGNESSCDFNITVEDNIVPIAICDEHTIVGLGTAFTPQNGFPNSSNGQPLALIEAHTFDDGSTDNCGIVAYDVRRMDNPNCPGFDGTAFGPTVPFYCCDLGSIVMVEFRVRDAAGNTNSCMVEVEVQDKIDPIIVCPAPKTINCDDDPTNLGLTGEATATDNCSDVTPSYTDISNTVDCGEGTILRLWRATDDAGNTSSCIQTITVVKLDPFTIVDTECRRYFPINHITPPVGPHSSKDDVEWPCDIELITCGLGLDPDDLYANGTINPITNQQIKLDARPTIFEGACDNVAMTHQDTELEFGGGDACLKILRKWIIIDWCQANENQDPTQPGPGVWHYTQVIKVVNSNDPIITPVNLPAIIENFEPNCGGTFAAFEITADDDCTAQADLDITHEFFRLVKVAPGVYEEVIISAGTGFAASDVLANGKYRLKFAVNDQCDNTAYLEHDFEVIDAKKPTPICIFGLSTVTMPNNGEVTLWASDFESGSSYDNCTPYGALEISFSSDVDDKYLTITCADIPADGLVQVEIWVTDGAGNQDFCSTFVSVLSAPGVCPNAAATISGTIENENQEVVEEVIVTLSDDAGLNFPVVTGTDGSFDFGMTYGNYDVTPEKDINYLNGVTTYDLVLISKHILGLELLDSPYKWIAADANNSQTITTLDIVKLRALILHIDDELANNTSWRFVDANHAFNTNNPLTEQFSEYVTLDGTSTVPVDFTAVKVGDVNGTATPNSLLGTDTRTFNGKLALQLDATKVAAEETFTVDFRAKDFNNIAGYQFTLGFDNSKVDFVDVASNLTNLSAENFGLTKLNEGVITTSWNANKGVSMDNDAVLFSMTFVAKANVTTEEVFTINSRYTEAEAYNGTDLFDVVLEFNGSEVANGFELYQNTPNPFKAETTIGFNLTEAGAVTLKVYDVAGRTLRLIEMDAAKGYNSVDLNRADLDATGVLYYQLETANETATKKMIIVD